MKKLGKNVNFERETVEAYSVCSCSYSCNCFGAGSSATAYFYGNVSSAVASVYGQ